MSTTICVLQLLLPPESGPCHRPCLPLGYSVSLTLVAIIVRFFFFVAFNKNGKRPTAMPGKPKKKIIKNGGKKKKTKTVENLQQKRKNVAAATICCTFRFMRFRFAFPLLAFHPVLFSAAVTASPSPHPPPPLSAVFSLRSSVSSQGELRVLRLTRRDKDPDLCDPARARFCAKLGQRVGKIGDSSMCRLQLVFPLPQDQMPNWPKIFPNNTVYRTFSTVSIFAPKITADNS